MTGDLLGPDDPSPVNLINGDGDSPVLLTCDHAGHAVPARLGGLGVHATEMDRHIAYDIGAEALAEQLSARLNAPLVSQSYSRLVIDCNRHPSVPDSIVRESDGTPIPRNHDLPDWDRTQRHREIHAPYHDTIAQLLDERTAAGVPVLLFSVHSFTPTMAGQDRPWHAGLLFNRDPRMSHALMAVLETVSPDLTLGYNEPYAVDDVSDYTIPVHGEQRGIPHALIEVRNDEIAHDDGIHRWADLLTHAVQRATDAILRDRTTKP